MRAALEYLAQPLSRAAFHRRRVFLRIENRFAPGLRDRPPRDCRRLPRRLSGQSRPRYMHHAARVFIQSNQRDQFGSVEQIESIVAALPEPKRLYLVKKPRITSSRAP